LEKSKDEFSPRRKRGKKELDGYANERSVSKRLMKSGSPAEEKQSLKLRVGSYLFKQPERRARSDVFVMGGRSAFITNGRRRQGISR